MEKGVRRNREGDKEKEKREGREGERTGERDTGRQTDRTTQSSSDLLVRRNKSLLDGVRSDSFAADALDNVALA